MNAREKTGHTISGFHKRRKRFVFFVKIDDFDYPKNTHRVEKLTDVNKNCNY